MILLILGCRDGLALVILGLALEQLLRRRWWLAGLGLSLGWLALLSGWLYPLLTAHYPGMNAGTSRYSSLGDSIGAIALGLIQQPQRILSHVDWAGAAVYLLLLALPLLPFWHQASLLVLLAGLPLIAVNIPLGERRQALAGAPLQPAPGGDRRGGSPRWAGQRRRAAGALAPDRLGGPGETLVLHWALPGPVGPGS